MPQKNIQRLKLKLEGEKTIIEKDLKSFAKEIGLNSAKFDSCFDSGKYRKDAEAASEEAKSLGVSGTPTTFVNGRVINGAVPFASFQKVIEEELIY